MLHTGKFVRTQTLKKLERTLDATTASIQLKFYNAFIIKDQDFTYAVEESIFRATCSSLLSTDFVVQCETFGSGRG